MATLLSMTNQIMRRLREDQVTAVDDNTVSLMAGEFINQAKQYCEDQWDWIQLRSSVDVTTSGGTYQYTMTGLTNRMRVLGDGSRGWPWAHVVDVTNSTQQLKFAPSSAWMTRMILEYSSGGQPLYFDINGNASGVPQVNLWPVPGGTYTIRFNVVDPQDDFALDGTDDATTITIPHMPVVLFATYYMRNERGDDDGRDAARLLAEATTTLNQAITREQIYAQGERRMFPR